MARRRTTAADVARRAGVSQATVSYVLNDTAHQTISDATRARVRKAAEELSYTPLGSARALRRGRSDLVVVLVPGWPLGQLLAAILETLATELARHDLELLIHCRDPRRSVTSLLRAVSPAAVVRLGSLGEAEDAALARAHAGFLLPMAVTEHESGVMAFPNRTLGRLQVELLAEAGRHRLGYAWPDDPRTAGYARSRLDGVRAECDRRGLPEPVVHEVSYDTRLLDAAVGAWREAGVTGVCSFNDDLALALLAAARRHGLSVPGDLALVGVDDLPAGRVCEPPLSTVGADVEGTARLMAAHLVHGVTGAGEPPPDPGDGLVRAIRRGSC